MTWESSSHELHQLAVTITLKKDAGHDLGKAHDEFLEFAMRLAFYAALTAIFLMVIALIVKLLFNFDVPGTEGEPGEEAATVTESSRLVLSKEEVVYSNYGTNEMDLESGSSSSSEDLYDGKICVICYDDQRNCFFFPCGHCVTCHTCANRIIKEESKSCPICRGFIDKVRRLHLS